MTRVNELTIEERKKMYQDWNYLRPWVSDEELAEAVREMSDRDLVALIEAGDAMAESMK